MKKHATLLGLILSLFLFAGMVYAYPETVDYYGDPDGTASSCERYYGEDKAVDTSVSEQSNGVWGHLGVVGALIALVNLLMQILKLRQLDNWLRGHKKLWIKPYISIVLGMLLGGFTAYQTGIGLIQSIFAGLMAGVAAVGVHESLNKRRAEKRQK